MDESMTEGWTDTLNVILTFVSSNLRHSNPRYLDRFQQAGLFSAVVTAFIMESCVALDSPIFLLLSLHRYQSYQPNYAELTAIATMAILAHLNGSTGASLPILPSLAAPPVTPTVRWVNGLWFSSLAISLIVALFAILAKQWIVEYRARIRTGRPTAQCWAWTHFVYRRGLETWHMDAFVSMLPLLLHLSLFLFLSGLAVFLLSLDVTLSRIVMCFTAAAGIFYVLALFAPLRFGECPSATPLLHWIVRLVQFALELLRQSWRMVHDELLWMCCVVRRPLGLAAYVFVPAYDVSAVTKHDTSKLTIDLVAWMLTNVPSRDEFNATVDAVGSLDLKLFGDFWSDEDQTPSASARIISSALSHRCRTEGEMDERQASRLLRAMLLTNTSGLLEDGFRLDRLLSLNAQTQDLHALSRVLVKSESSFRDLSQNLLKWFVDPERPTCSPLHPSTMDCIIRRVDKDVGLKTSINVAEYAAMLSMVMSDESQIRILTTCLLASFEAEGVQYDALPESCDWRHKALHVWSFVFDSWPDLVDGDFNSSRIWEVYSGLLLLAKDAAPVCEGSHPAALTFMQVAQCFAYIGSEHAQLHRLSSETFLSISAAFVRGLLTQSGTWCQSAGDVFFALLQEHRARGIYAAALVSAVIHALPTEENIHMRIAERFEEETAMDTHLNLLSLRESNSGEKTAWELALASDGVNLADCRRLAEYLLVLMATTPFGGKELDVTCMLDRLLGNQRGVMLVYNDAMNGLFVAQHVENISRQWWTDTLRPALISAREEEGWWWRPSDAHPDVLAFVKAVDAADTCEGCTSIITGGSERTTAPKDVPVVPVRIVITDHVTLAPPATPADALPVPPCSPQRGVWQTFTRGQVSEPSDLESGLTSLPSLQSVASSAQNTPELEEQTAFLKPK